MQKAHLSLSLTLSHSLCCCAACLYSPVFNCSAFPLQPHMHTSLTRTSSYYLPIFFFFFPPDERENSSFSSFFFQFFLCVLLLLLIVIHITGMGLQISQPIHCLSPLQIFETIIQNLCQSLKRRKTSLL